MPRLAVARTFVSAVAVAEAGLVGFLTVSAVSGDDLGIFRSLATAFGTVFALTAVPAMVLMIAGRVDIAAYLATASALLVAVMWWLA